MTTRPPEDGSMPMIEKAGNHTAPPPHQDPEQNQQKEQ